eukprot:TRINITY_DN26232_c0_g1_i1.p1 TRINITY_DN26232_c0_g1~~TRINITY_DN26232_c0_g1_i1.p1  ORF type:complete len:179 (+),score=30.12 TRINITY_DN26232_c0_g1_i1:488-1024(+)
MEAVQSLNTPSWAKKMAASSGFHWDARPEHAPLGAGEMFELTGDMLGEGGALGSFLPVLGEMGVPKLSEGTPDSLGAVVFLGGGDGALTGSPPVKLDNLVWRASISSSFCSSASSSDWNLASMAVSYTHLRAHETPEHLVCRLLLEKKKNRTKYNLHKNYIKQQILTIIYIKQYVPTR